MPRLPAIEMVGPCSNAFFGRPLHLRLHSSIQTNTPNNMPTYNAIVTSILGGSSCFTCADANKIVQSFEMPIAASHRSIDTLDRTSPLVMKADNAWGYKSV